MDELGSCIGVIFWILAMVLILFWIFEAGVRCGRSEGEVAIWQQAVKAGVAEPVANMDTGIVEYKFVVVSKN